MDKSKIQTGLVSGQPDVWFKRNHDLSTEDDDLEKCILELCQTAMIKPRQIDRYGFFRLDHNWQTRVYRLVLGQQDIWLWRN